MNPFNLFIIGVSNSPEGFHYWIIKEFYYEGRKEGRVKRNSEYKQDLIDFIDSEGRRVDHFYFDPSATGFIAEVKDMDFTIEKVDNTIMSGVESLTELIGQIRVHINKDECPELTLEISSYIWDEKAQARGEDIPLKKSDHGPDGIRYAIYNHEINPPVPTNFWKEMGANLVNF